MQITKLHSERLQPQQLHSQCLMRPQQTHRSRRAVSCSATLHARWCLDARYGCKQEATLLLQEWVQTVGKSAGLSANNTRLSSGSVGVPESRLEMEVTFGSMAEFEQFLASIPYQQHKAWTQRIQSMVVDGSPVWQVHRAIPITISNTPEAAATRDIAPPKQNPAAASPQQLVFTDQISSQDMAAWEQLKRDSSSGSGSISSGSSSPMPPASPPPGGAGGDGDADAADAAAPVQRDWKGDPIKFNPGDKLPFKFL